MKTTSRIVHGRHGLGRAHRRGSFGGLLSVALLTFTAAAAGGCATTDQEWVQYADAELESLVRVEDARATRLPGSDLLQVQVPITNLSPQEIQLLVQVEFRDATGAPYDDETTRRVWLLPRGATKTFTATSQKARASDFVVRLWKNRAG